MSTTYLFEELDEATREYLLEVRRREGKKSPGVFAPVSHPWPAVGIFLGPCVVAATLLLTLTSWIDVVYDDPKRVALLQTAGLLLGGWMFVAALRSWARKKSPKYAGHWVYADPLHLYQAHGEQVRVTPLDGLRDATCQHNYNNNTYTGSAVKVRLARKTVVPVSINDEKKAGQFTVYLNYLAWAYSAEGGARADLKPAQLGGLARYFSKNESEPLDADQNIDFHAFEVDFDEVPGEPRREGRAVPAFVPYLILVPAGVLCFFVMAALNVPIRDDAIYEAVTTAPVEPRFLRAYLTDPRNTRHRKEVYDKLAPFYDGSINSVRQNAKNEVLKNGFVQVLDSLRRTDQPVVSIRVTEMKTPPGQEGGALERVKRFREGVADRTNAEFARVAPAVLPPPDVVFTVQPPPVGHQLIAFALMPEDAPNPHFDVEYSFDPAPAPGLYRLTAKVTIRVNVDDAPVAQADIALDATYAANQADQAALDLKERLIRDMVGAAVQAPAFGQPPVFGQPPAFGQPFPMPIPGPFPKIGPQPEQ